MAEPRVLVFSSLFPSKEAPSAGPFIKERMFRLGKRMPLVVVAPQPWSPLDWLIRLKRKSFRPMAASFEVVEGIEVHRPRVLSVPGVLKGLDGWLMAKGSKKVFQSLATKFKPTIVDAHFVYPDGYAASLLAREAKLPLTITIRGSKDEWLIGTPREPMLRSALHQARKVFAVSQALKRDVGLKLGLADDKVTVIGNGVDLKKFQSVDRLEARKRLGLSPEAKVIIGVGGLIERKGFHRVIPLLQELRKSIPEIKYLIVGGGFSQGDMRQKLEDLAAKSGVADIVQFCGPQLPTDLKWFYGAADVFVLATAHEGWANVFLEAMACGLPVITTDVGGNSQVVKDTKLGTVVPYWQPDDFRIAIQNSLTGTWDSAYIQTYAQSNEWETRIDQLERELRTIESGTR